MKKLVILMTLALAMSTAALANPIFQDRGSEASNALYQAGGGDCDDTDRCVRPGKVALTVLKWVDDDSNGDGISDGIALDSSETLSTNKGQVISSITSEKKPKFKAGAELSKTPNSMYVGDLDGDGFGDIAISIRQEETRNKDTYRVTATSTEDWKLPEKVEVLTGGGLIEAMASASPSPEKVNSLGEIILGEVRDMVMPGDNVQVTEGDVNVEELELAVEKIERAR